MLRPRFRSGALSGLVVTGALLASLAGCTDGGSSGGGGLVIGGTQIISGRLVSTWAQLDANNNVQKVGATVPFAVIQNPPAQMGTGPAGAIAVLPFPVQAQATTYFNHLELHWEPMGHPPDFTMVPHFDIHFYTITEAQVRAVTSPDPADPAANRIPANYILPPAFATVPEMGRHAFNPAQYQGTYTNVDILGYYNGQMIFLEEMPTQAYLLSKANFTVAVPRPAALGKSTLYPATFTATYSAATDSYTFVYSNFTAIQ